MLVLRRSTNETSAFIHKSSSLEWAANSKQIQQHCAFTQMADICCVSFTVTLVYRNTQFATVTINCIRLLQDIWLLEWGKWADFGAQNKTDKMNEHRT